MPESEIPNGEYMYCIIRSREPRQFSTLGIGERQDVVYTLHYRDLAVVVSDSPVVEYDSSRRNMMAHTLVLEEVMQEYTILPVRFGIVAPSAQEIEEKVLPQRYEELDDLLVEIEGQVEMGLKAFWYEDAIFKEIADETPAIRRLRDSLVGRTSEETYYERIRLGEMIENAMWQKRDDDAGKILSRLNPLVSKTRGNKVITDRMVLNAALLVEKVRVPEVDRVIEELDQEMGKRLIFKYVGPVPPYNFVNIIFHWGP